MIAAVLLGVGEQDGPHPGRNMYPVLGRPLMAYPLLAAAHAELVDRWALSTNSPSMAQVAQGLDAEVIWRPPELCAPEADMADILRHAVLAIEERSANERVDQLVVLLANAPAVTADLIDRGLTLLADRPTYDSVVTVAIHNEYNPAHACFISDSNELVSFLSPPLFRNLAVWRRDALGDIYFIDNCVRIVRRESLFGSRMSSRLPYPWMGERTAPILHQGGYDVDYDWQIPGVERWLRQQGFSDTALPYDRQPKAADDIHPALAAGPTSAGVGTTGRVLVTTVPFGEIDPEPLRILDENNIPYVINPIGRRLKEDELADLIGEFEVIIGGTEPVTPRALDRAPNLRLIARVGIGLDNVPLLATRERGISVTYTPDAPSAAVAELTIGQMLALLRRTASADRGLRQGVWHRWIGRRLGTLTVGVIGVGRVGRRVIRHLQGWSPLRVLANDLVIDDEFARLTGCVWADKETLLAEANIVTLHVPLTPRTRNLIGAPELARLRPDAILINTARGGVVDEAALAAALRRNPNFSAAVDVFNEEPYSGELAGLDNCLLSCHMGSATRDCRLRMEVEATQEVIRYFRGEPFANPVPAAEYALQAGQ